MRAALWGLLALILFASGVEAATLFAAPSDLGAGNCTSTGNACDLQQAINAAAAGDTIEAAPGTYGSDYTISTNGTSGAGRITLKSTNLHGAILIGSGGDCNVGANETPQAFNAGGDFWIIEGFDIRDMCFGIKIEAANVEVRHNLITGFGRWGVGLNGASAHVHHNVVAFGFGPGALITDNDWMGIGMPGSGSTIEHNAIYSIGSRASTFHGHHGVGLMAQMTQDVMIRGNIFMDAAKTTGARIFGQTLGGCVDFPTPACTQAFNNTMRDNIIAYGQGGAMAYTENTRDNFMINNVFMGVWEYTGPSAKGNDPGRNTYSHNTMIFAPQSYLGMSLECGSEVNNVCSRASVVQNNLFYSPDTTSSRLLVVSSQADSIATKSHNHIYQPGGGGFGGYTLTGTDLTTQPVFENAAAGDYRLAAGSPGKGSASDSTDRGANFDGVNLIVERLQNLVAFPTAECTVTGATSAAGCGNFSGLSTSHYYQVWGYNPSSPVNALVSFNIEGFTNDVNPADMDPQPAPHRYFYLTTVITNGTLTMTWDNSSALEKIFIRRMPTAAEAYVIITSAAAPGGPTSPAVGVIATGDDDAEQLVSTGAVTLNSTDLEIPDDVGGAQLIGLRFTGLDVPPGATCDSATIQFTGDSNESPNSGNPTLTLKVQDHASPATFTAATNDISARTLRAESVVWSPGAWTQGVANAASLTPDLCSIMTPVLTNSAIVVVISGTAGKRSADAFEGAAPAVLTIAWTAGPVAHYEMDSLSGTTAIDSSANALDGALCNGATCPQQGPVWVAGKVGVNALDFDGSNDRVVVTDDPLLDFGASQDFTVAFWARTSQAAAAFTWPGLVEKSGGNTTGWDVILHDALADGANRWAARIWIGATPTAVFGDTDVADGTWHHLAFKREGTTLTTYEDGVLSNTGTVSGGDLSNANPLTWGASYDLAACCWYNGDLDDLRLYPYALDDAEVAALAAMGGGDVTPPAAPTNFRVVKP